ncbi:MAG: sigma 54-interacting transcriptional regulator [Bacteroidota bacterium]|nr:sigma 54-interacting transcriptional regulator [Bacteroidota bacterium]
MAEYCRKTGEDCYGVRELKLLFEISTLLNKVKHDLKSNLDPVIELLANYLTAEKVILTILNRANNQISIEVAWGLSEEEQSRGTYKVGEGIIGKVVETGKPVVIPKIQQHDGYLNKTKLDLNGRDLSFICVPIREEDEIVGTLSIHRTYNQHITIAEDARILSIVGSMVAQAVRTRQEYAEEIGKLVDENTKLHSELKERIRPANIIGNSGKMHAVFDLIERVAPTNATVLIRGESGVGKESIADAIHYNSLRKNKPFIKVNCAALPDSLIESELFGHERGAFTGANVMRKGRFEAADGGTIFLDEIGDLPASTQVKLLRILQEREFERLGSTKPIKVDVRIVCATNRNLEECIEKGTFREDLYYRINVFPIYIPALRERLNDIPALADHFITKFNKNHNKTIKRISASAIDMLMVYHWPGNIRELENCMERACILSYDNVIRSSNLPPTLQTAISSKTKSSGTLEAVVDKVEKQMILDTLIGTRGNLVKAAEILGITERMMGIRIKKYEIDPKRYKVDRKNGKTAA